MPNLAKTFLHKSTTAKFYLITESNKDLLEKKREDIVGAPFFFYKESCVVDENLIRDSTMWCRSTVGIDASLLYHFPMNQAMPHGLYTRWELDSESGKIKPRQNKTRKFENMVILYFQRVRPQHKVQSFHTTGTQKNFVAYSFDGFCGHCNTVFEAMGRYYRYCPYKESRPLFTAEENPRGIRKTELNDLFE